MKYKYLLDEDNVEGWLPLNEAIVQPIQQVLKIVLNGEKTENLSDQTEPRM